MSADLESGSQSRYEQDRTWLTANIGGPILKDRLYFYGSYYRPTRTRDNRANLYGELPDYDSTRNEGFGKLTFTPTKTMLLNFSYRDSKRDRHERAVRRQRRADHRHRRRGAPQDRHGRRLVGDQLEELRHRQVHPLRERHPGPARQHRRRRHLDGGRHAAERRAASTRRGACSCRCR